jgi:hypothetical protein
MEKGIRSPGAGAMPRFVRTQFVSAAILTAALAGCAGTDTMQQASLPPASTPVPPSIPADAVAGRWGLASYHRDEDRARTETAARGQCNKPYEIGRGATGGVIMHLADQPQAQELVLKGATGGRTFIGPAGEPGGQQDREIISHDGKTMIMRWVDAEVGARYGTLVFAKCDATAARPPASRPAPARKGQ